MTGLFSALSLVPLVLGMTFESLHLCVVMCFSANSVVCLPACYHSALGQYHRAQFYVISHGICPCETHCAFSCLKFSLARVFL